MSNKETLVQWLQESLSIHLTFEQQMQFEGLFQQAKELEKQQIIDAWYDGEAHWDSGKNGNEYYNKTYGGQDNEQ